MRLTLIDLLVLDALFLGGILVGALTAHFVGLHDWLFLAFGFGIAAIVAFASLIYQRFHFRPLFLPKCPHCKKRPSQFSTSESRWPRETVICADCHTSVELWYDQPASELVSTTMPSLRSHWPQFLGIWRPVPKIKGVIQ